MDKSPKPRPGITKREAAADEMYEALKYIAKRIEVIASWDGTIATKDVAIEAEIYKAYDALAKADGAQ